MKKISSSNITKEKHYLNRRFFIKGGVASMLSVIPIKGYSFHNNSDKIKILNLQQKKDKLNSYEEITTYNNFYEFGMGKSDPSSNSNKFKPLPNRKNIVPDTTNNILTLRSFTFNPGEINCQIW